MTRTQILDEQINDHHEVLLHLGCCFWTDLVILFGQFVMAKNMYLGIPIAFFERCLRNYNYLIISTMVCYHPSWWATVLMLVEDRMIYLQVLSRPKHGARRWAGFVTWFPWNFRPRLARFILFKGSLVFQIACHVDATIEDWRRERRRFSRWHREWWGVQAFEEVAQESLLSWCLIVSPRRIFPFDMFGVWQKWLGS